MIKINTENGLEMQFEGSGLSLGVEFCYIIETLSKKGEGGKFIVSCIPVALAEIFTKEECMKMLDKAFEKKEEQQKKEKKPKAQKQTVGLSNETFDTFVGEFVNYLFQQKEEQGEDDE